MRNFILITLTVFSFHFISGQDIEPGAGQFDHYLPLLKGKKVGLLVNHTSVVGERHLIDILLDKSVEIDAVFTPEHGIKGTADAGEKVENGLYKGKIPVYSLYGKNKKPVAEQLKGLDIVIFDIQDVGARFYTYISTMHYMMEACGENKVRFMVLDRPNPNGMYVAGPVRKAEFKSFVGMHPIPILHGMTVGELAQMINGEKWIKVPCELKVIKCSGYTHDMKYSLPIKPSPNLPNDLSIQTYPSLCLFEGTDISVGRGTYQPFQQIGHPSFKGKYDHSFKPVSIEGMSKYPKHENQLCYGYNMHQSNLSGFDIKYLIEFYRNFENKAQFFKADFFDKLCGTDQVRKDIIAGLSQSEIEAKWEKEISRFKIIRKPYLIYP